ncbi:MAG: class I SAM-dependent methyltransferase [Planctomycetales bacterium]|nr:class I SAM-dependent methyltransferase [Planctomycetales bacterium]
MGRHAHPASQVESTMIENPYDYPQYYDLIFAADWRQERDFLLDCFQTYARRRVQRVFEPACGTGRLLLKLAQAGLNVSGNDLNAKAVGFCNRRLLRYGFLATAEVGDMSDFRLRRKVDAGFNLINSFRHLGSESAAAAHLECMAAAIRPGGLYVLGLHLTPTSIAPQEHESWSARRGSLKVVSTLWTIELNTAQRAERVGMAYDVTTPARSFRLESEFTFRTYTARQMLSLLKKVPQFEIAGVHDFGYCVDSPVRLTSASEDVIFVLRRK